MSYSKVLILNFPKIALEAPPLAPGLLCEICNQNNIEYDFIDCNLDFYQQLKNDDLLKNEILGLFAERFIDKLSDTAQEWVDKYYEELAKKCKNYDLIAISVFTAHSQNLVLEFLSKHKSKFSADIVAGGAGLSSTFKFDIQFYQHLRNNNLIDYWVLGEGEIAFRDIILKNFSSAHINNKEFNRLPDFKNVPIPNFDKFRVDDYVYFGKKIVAVEGSRGCVRKCTFCDIEKTWGRYKFKDGKSLAKELMTLRKKYQADHFWFNDSLINGSLKSFRDFIYYLAKARVEKQDQFTWSSQAIVRTRSRYDERDFKLLKESGCETLAVGIESFSEPVRYHMGKKFSDDDMDWFFELAQKYNISCYILLIVGYPTETQKDFERTLEQLYKYQHLADDGTISGLRIGGTMSVNRDIPIWHMRDEIGIEYNEDMPKASYTWSVGENTLKKRVDWRLAIEDYARHLGYSCSDSEMSIEQTLLNFLQVPDK